jgi:hypothetical protein
MFSGSSFRPFFTCSARSGYTSSSRASLRFDSQPHVTFAFHNITLSSPAFLPQGTLRGRTLLEQGAANGHAPAVTRLLAAGLHQVSVAGPTLELLLYKSNTSSSFHVSWSQPALLDCKK